METVSQFKLRPSQFKVFLLTEEAKIENAIPSLQDLTTVLFLNKTTWKES